MAGDVVTLADRLKQRRQELGLSQAQAARELDVARTAYRLWEMEAAKPAPDRWRLISRWLGVSVTTMLLAEDLITSDEASRTTDVESAYAHEGGDWDAVAAAQTGDFFAQGRALVASGLTSGSLTAEQAAELGGVIDRLERERRAAATAAWKPAQLRKSFVAGDGAPFAARQAVAFVAEGLPTETVDAARLLVGEVVTESVLEGPSSPATVGVAVDVGRSRVRVEVSDGRAAASDGRDEPGSHARALLDDLASGWGREREGDTTVTWFEIDVRTPGSDLPPDA